MKKNLKKIMYLTTLSSLLMTGCEKKQEEPETKIILKRQEKKQQVLNETVYEIMADYIDLNGTIYSYSDFSVDKMDNLDDLYCKDNKYVYDYHLGNPNDSLYEKGYVHVEDDDSFMYVVKLQIDDLEVPVASVVNIDGQYYNVYIHTYDHLGNLTESGYVEIPIIDDKVISDLEEACSHDYSLKVLKKKTL